MALLRPFGSVVDPHCGRPDSDRIDFRVAGEQWEVQWGPWDAFGTASYWVNQSVRPPYPAAVSDMAASGDVTQETIFCLLGGFGVTAESAQTAHTAVLAAMADDPTPTAERIEAVLRAEPPGGGARYRFPAQRAGRIAGALRTLKDEPPPDGAAELRDYLLALNGVGPKTAAWIVRNVTGSAAVAIIDIWLIRALTALGVFPAHWRVDRHYDRYDTAFGQYAEHGDSAAALDLCIWDQARNVGHAYWQTHPSSLRTRQSPPADSPGTAPGRPTGRHATSPSPGTPTGTGEAEKTTPTSPSDRTKVAAGGMP